MKKFLILTSVIILMAAACNKQAAISPTPTPTPTATNDLAYTNSQYGFNMTLQPDWTGYSVLNQTWQGTDVASGKVTEHGPQLVLRHPKWTDAAHYEDIPVMVFTMDQWTKVTGGKISLGAAPIGPSELGRNTTYVFALPARYNYDFATGYEEADKIAHTLKTFDPSVSTASWKTYANTKYGFGFQYPSNSEFKVSPTTAEPSNVLNITLDNPEVNIYRQINVYSKSSFAAQAEYKAQFNQLELLVKNYTAFKQDLSLVDKGSKGPDSGPIYINTLKTKIDGIPALDIRSASVGGPDRKVIFEKGNFVYTLYNAEDYFVFNSKTNKMEAVSAEKVDPAFEKLISTFKFTK
jgi:hypothetical protein